MTGYLSQNKTPFVIGVAGGSGSGKTTFARQLIEFLGEDNCLHISQDHYYIDQSHKFDFDGGIVNFDHPDSLDFPLLAEHLARLKQGLEIQIPIYDFVTHSRQEKTNDFAPRPLVIVEGILIFHPPEVFEYFDLAYFVEAPEKVRFERRLRRDVEERGRKAEGVKRQFQTQVAPMHDQFVAPTKAHAHQIVCGQSPYTPILEELKRHPRVHERIHFKT